MPTHRLSCALVMAIMAVPLVSLRAQEIVRLTPANGRVAIWNLVGNARIEQGSAREVEVLITPRGSDGARMITRSGLIDGEQTLRIFYPVDEVRPASASRSRRSNASTTLRMRDDGRFGGTWNGGRRMKLWSGAEFEASADLVIRVPADVALEMHVALGDVDAGGTSRGLRIDTHAGTVRTAGTRGPLDIDTGSGAVEVTQHEGDLSVDTGSGSIEASRVTGARTISLDTGSGAVVLDRCYASAALTVDTGSGRVTARDIEAPDMTLETGSGSVEVAPTSSAGALHVDTGSGSVTLIAPSDFGAHLEISTGSGGIRSDLPLQALRRADGELTATIGDGRARISIETGSGGVSIRSRL